MSRAVGEQHAIDARSRRSPCSGIAGDGFPLHHVGDLGNIEIQAGTVAHDNADWTLGDGSTTDVTGHAIIFHALTDDGSMPSAGARHGCGIIVPVEP